ncbi:hypothetical protein [Nocardioides sp. GY 10127]|uniref:hypothetical protein n=1 Tax=Nocardioides sp. GY 10127 TaxID=2569762 RepID=UPI0010A8257E|nr:hypothetical protein [Nocardioides sp. GY 10127]TIC84078.1 hypothetical protein E8D37_04530 [Nocardioides sp. GY 10127]
MSRRPDPRGPRSGGRRPHPLVLAPAAGLVTTGAATLLAAVVPGAADGAVPGAVVGGLVGVGVLALGAGAVAAVSRVLPAASLIVALLTYSLQLVLLVAVLSALGDTALAADPGARRWLAGTLVAVVLTWSLAHLVAATRQRIPTFDLSGPESAPGSATPGGPAGSGGSPTESEAAAR